MKTQLMFTQHQYEQAIEALRLGGTQLAPDGANCAICGDTGHQAFECGRNPLVAMAICRTVARQSDALHDSLHMLSGHVTRMGEPVGPAKVIVPESEPNAPIRPMAKNQYPANEGWVRLTLTMKSKKPLSEDEIKKIASMGHIKAYEWGPIEQCGAKVKVVMRSIVEV